MIGKKTDPDSIGIDCLAIQQLFDFAEENESSEITIWVSYMEIYNEVINDLLDKEGTNLKIREDTSGTMGAYVEGLTSLKIQNYQEFMDIFERGEKIRNYAKTKLSEKYTDVYSSRSHTIVRLMVQNKPNNANFVKDDEKTLHLSYSVKYSILNLVDLAGSERLSDVGMNRTKETSHINTSLFVLSKVINSLAEKSKSTHIPFRDSKLTKLLKNSLGGNSMTSVICTVSPNFDHLPLTISTLEFAKRAKNIKVKARANEVIDDHDIVQNKLKIMEKLIMKLERSVDQLNNEIDKQKKTNIKLKQEAKDKEDKMREQKEIMVKEFQEQLKNMSQEADPKSIPLPPSLVTPVYISKQDIDGKCQGCEKDLLNVANFITKAKELVDPDHYNTFETRLDEIESHCNTEFGKCSDCKQVSEEKASRQKELSIKASKISRECQTDAVHTEDYLFFQNMIEDYLQVCLRSKPYKAVKMDFKLKDSQKKELIMDLFKFKVAIKSKIQAFIDKYEAAHAIQEQIQEFSELVKEHEESKKKSKEADEQLEKEKKKIVEQLSKWANMNKEEPALQEKDTPQKEKLMDEMNPYTDLPSSPQSINSLNTSDI